MNRHVRILGVVVLLVVICDTLATSATLLHSCKNYCMSTKTESEQLCELYCHGGFNSTRELEIYDDGKLVTLDTWMSDQEKLDIPQVRFNKALFTTPSAFDELVKWTGVLQQQVAASAESVFGSSAKSQFHLLTVPIPLSSEQLNSQAFMDRLLDVVPDSNLVFKEASPLTFSEAYRQFLLDVKVDKSNFKANPTKEQLDKIKDYEQRAQNEMDSFLDKGNKCFMAYETYLMQKHLTRIAYTFDTFSVTDANCKAADRHMANHERISNDLTKYVDSLNPHDQLFKALGNLVTTSGSASWNNNKDMISAFSNEMRQLERSGKDSASKFHIKLNMAKYYFKKEVFGTTTQQEESCTSAHVDFTAHGWKQVAVNPSGNWFSASTLNAYISHPTNSKKVYFQQKGVLQRMITDVIVAYKPVLKFTVTNAMKQQFITHSVGRRRPYEFSSMVFDKVEFKGNSELSKIGAVEMIMTTNIPDPQIIGYKSKPFTSLSIPKASTGTLSYCKRENACEVRRLSLIPIHHYWNMGAFNSFYTSNYKELEKGKNGYTYSGILGYCFADQKPGTAPLYRYNGDKKGRLYTTNWNELQNGRDGYKYEGVVCYVSTKHESGTVPMYRYYNAKVNDRAYPTDPAKLPFLDPKQFYGLMHHPQMFGVGQHMIQRALTLNNNYVKEGIAGYLFTKSSIDQAISCCKCD